LHRSSWAGIVDIIGIAIDSGIVVAVVCRPYKAAFGNSNLCAGTVGQAIGDLNDLIALFYGCKCNVEPPTTSGVGFGKDNAGTFYCAVVIVGNPEHFRAFGKFGVVCCKYKRRCNNRNEHAKHQSKG